MLEIYQLEQLISIAKCGTLSKAAEELHLSQPALSRSIKRLEEELQVELFQRQKNKIVLNPNGELAVEYAQKLVNQVQDMIDRIRGFDRGNRTIAIGSCAPAPLWELAPVVSALYHEAAISTEIKGNHELVQGLKEGIYQMVILPYPMEESDVYCAQYGKESLLFTLPANHPLSNKKELCFKDMDGEAMLLFSNIGFWHKVSKEKMPLTKFLLQDERTVFDEIVKASELPSFTSDVVLKRAEQPKNRIVIPIVDKEAKVNYYCICKTENREKLSAVFQELQRKGRIMR